MKNVSNSIIVTRHADLILLLEKWGLVTPDTPRIEHTDNIEDVRGRDVIGVCPAKLAIYANSVTEVPLAIPRELRGQELSIEELETMASAPITYEVRQMETRTDFSEAILASIATTFIQYVIRHNIMPRGGEQHMRAVRMNGHVKREEIIDKPVFGHLPYHMAQYALDMSTITLYYDFERRGKVHTYEEMLKYNPQIMTYSVKAISS